MQFGKPVIIIPAWNEEKYIGKTLDLVRKALDVYAIGGDIIVVNDGSTDRTKQIAESFGVRVIDLPKNVGKANAFFAGVKEALKTNPLCVVTLDADMLSVPSQSLNLMIREAHYSTTRKKTEMFIAGSVKEGNMDCSLPDVGLRSFSLWSLHKLIRSPIKKFPKGFGLEHFLNFFFSGKYSKRANISISSENISILKEAKFVCANAHREFFLESGPRKQKQLKELDRARDTLLRKKIKLLRMRRGMP